MDRKHLDALYEQYNRREYVHPDPLEFLYRYPGLEDREVAGMVASSLAYGRVARILASVQTVLDRMGPSPHAFVMESSFEQMAQVLAGIVHRFSTGADLARLFFGLQGVLKEYGLLGHAFGSFLEPGHSTVLPALARFCREITKAAGGELGHLLPSPDRGSACKRLHLFLRWMVRKDAVDPGGWDEIPADKLIIPLDVHMHRIGICFGFTHRKQGDEKTALEVTEGFRRILPEDPVRYDFALTRFGIRKDLDADCILKNNSPFL